MTITVTPVIRPLCTYPTDPCNEVNKIEMRINAPRTMLGTVVVAVALILVPNCSAAMVTNMAQKPVPKPSNAQAAYRLAVDWPLRLKNHTIPIAVNRSEERRVG